MLAAAAAGRVGEDGSGAMWIAPELVRPSAEVESCSGQVRRQIHADLVFEMIPHDAHAEAALRGVLSRKGVFEWNAAGELVFAGAAPTGIFGGLEGGAAYSAAAARSCGSG